MTICARSSRCEPWKSAIWPASTLGCGRNGLCSRRRCSNRPGCARRRSCPPRRPKSRTSQARLGQRLTGRHLRSPPHRKQRATPPAPSPHLAPRKREAAGSPRRSACAALSACSAASLSLRALHSNRPPVRAGRARRSGDAQGEPIVEPYRHSGRLRLGQDRAPAPHCRGGGIARNSFDRARSQQRSRAARRRLACASRPVERGGRGQRGRLSCARRRRDLDAGRKQRQAHFAQPAARFRCDRRQAGQGDRGRARTSRRDGAPRSSPISAEPARRRCSSRGCSPMRCGLSRRRAAARSTI